MFLLLCVKYFCIVILFFVAQYSSTCLWMEIRLWPGLIAMMSAGDGKRCGRCLWKKNFAVLLLQLFCPRFTHFQFFYSTFWMLWYVFAQLLFTIFSGTNFCLWYCVNCNSELSLPYFLDTCDQAWRCIIQLCSNCPQRLTKWQDAL